MAKAGFTAMVTGCHNASAKNPAEFHIMLDIAFVKPAMPKSGALVLLIGEGEMPSGVWQQADEVMDGAIGRAFKAAEFNGVKGEALRFWLRVLDCRVSWLLASESRRI